MLDKVSKIEYAIVVNKNTEGFKKRGGKNVMV